MQACTHDLGSVDYLPITMPSYACMLRQALSVFLAVSHSREDCAHAGDVIWPQDFEDTDRESGLKTLNTQVESKA